MKRAYSIGDKITFKKVLNHEHEFINGIELFCLSCASVRAREQRKGLEAIKRDHVAMIKKSRYETMRKKIFEVLGWVVSSAVIVSVFYMFALVASIEN